MYARLPSLLFLLCSFLLLVSAYKSDIPALRQQPDVARELAQPANTYVWGACSRSNLGLGMYAAQNFNHMAQLMCITPQSGGLTFGAQDLTISNPDGAPLTIYHTDGSDCYTTGSYFAHYGGCMKTSSSRSISSSCPCYDSVCCAIVKCGHTNSQRTCRYGVSTTLFYAPGVAPASPSSMPTQSRSRSISFSSTRTRSACASASNTPSRTPTRTSTPTKTAVATPTRSPTPTQTRPPPGQLPASWDPRTDLKYGVCYNTGILDQGECGSCYAHSPAYVVSIAMCRALVDAGLRGVAGGPMKLVSPQYMLAIKKVQAAYSPDTFCSGGSPTMLLLSYAVNIHNARNQGGLTKLSRDFNVLTCKTTSNGEVCGTGCYPYTAGGCPAPSGGVVNPAGGTGGTAAACNSLSFEQRICPATGTLDAESFWLTNITRFWTAVPSMVDPEFPAASWAGTSMLTGFKINDITAQPQVEQDRFWGAYDSMDNVAANGQWSAAVIAAVKRYLFTRGSLAVALNMCDAMQTFISNAVRNNVGPRVYDGPACPRGINHAVTILGWADVPDSAGRAQPSWIIRNEWGPRWGWSGDFYLSIASAAVTNGALAGSASLTQPFGIAFFVPPPGTGPRGRQLAEDHERRMEVVRGHSARLLRELEANPPPPTGVVMNCSDDESMLRLAAAVAMQSMDKTLPAVGLSYTGFSVHVLECQTVGLGRIFKAAVTAQHPITGARDAAHITFFHGENREAAPPAGPPVDAQGLPIFDENGVQQDFPGYEEEEDGYSVPPPPAPQGGNAPDDKGLSYRRRLNAAAGGIAPSPPATTTIVYDAVVNAGTTSNGGSASAPGTDAAPVTNPNAMIDVFGVTLSVRAQVMLIQSAIIIVGAFLLAALVGAGVCIYRNRGLFKIAARKTSEAFKHGADTIKAAVHHSANGAAVAPAPADGAPAPADGAPASTATASTGAPST